MTEQPSGFVWKQRKQQSREESKRVLVRNSRQGSHRSERDCLHSNPTLEHIHHHVPKTKSRETEQWASVGRNVSLKEFSKCNAEKVKGKGGRGELWFRVSHTSRAPERIFSPGKADSRECYDGFGMNWRTFCIDKN